MNFTVSVALVFNQYVNPIGLEHLNWKYYVRVFAAAHRKPAAHQPLKIVGGVLLLALS